MSFLTMKSLKSSSACCSCDGPKPGASWFSKGDSCNGNPEKNDPSKVGEVRADDGAVMAWANGSGRGNAMGFMRLSSEVRTPFGVMVPLPAILPFREKMSSPLLCFRTVAFFGTLKLPRFGVFGFEFLRTLDGVAAAGPRPASRLRRAPDTEPTFGSSKSVSSSSSG
jgi:hypothetical protein